MPDLSIPMIAANHREPEPSVRTGAGEGSAEIIAARSEDLLGNGFGRSA
jgi:hypothetical protein